MADTKITALTAITTVDPAADVLPIVDVSDTSMAASGTTKKITSNQILGAGGTATLASATITGDLTVDTSTLVVNSSQNRVGIGFSGNASSGRLQISQPLGSTIDGALRITDDATTSFVFNNVSSGVSGIWSSGAIAFGVGSGTFSEAMRLNSTGLGVGISSPFADAGYKSIDLRGTTGGEVVLGSTSSREGTITADGTNGITINTINSTPLRFFTQGGEKMRLDVAGNVGIGVTPSAWANLKTIQFGGGSSIGGGFNANWLQANAFYDGTNWKYIATAAASRLQHDDAFKFFIAPSGTAGNAITFTQAMTLDASGRLLVNNSSTGDHRFEVSGTNATNSYAAKFSGGSSTSNGVYFYLPGTRSSDTTYYLQRYGDDAAVRFQIFGNGNVQNTTGTYGTISDLRLKENISDARNYLADLLKLRVVKYSLKSDASPSANLLGLIAQEVEQVFPTLVETSGDDVKSVKTTVLIPMLLKALQELTARVQTLETR